MLGSNGKEISAMKNHASCTQWAGKVAARHSEGLTSSRRAGLEKHALALVALIILVVGASFLIIENHHSSANSNITPLTVTVNHTPTKLPAALNLPCPSARDFSEVHRLCQHHEFQVVNQSRTIQGNKTLTLVAGHFATSNIAVSSALENNTDQEPDHLFQRY